MSVIVWESRQTVRDVEYRMQYQLWTASGELRYRRLYNDSQERTKYWDVRKSLNDRNISRERWQARIENRGYRIKRAVGERDTMIAGTWHHKDRHIHFSAKLGEGLVNQCLWSSGGQLKLPVYRNPGTRRWYPTVIANQHWCKAMRQLCEDTFKYSWEVI